ncbi:hypothetical protein ACG0Z6_12725 [Roseateles sp. BYS180W]|uniref:Uncharacterized protein n=1 Tax=Roseateles rivi TaxID=3299028 RepID=A0ABW7FXQ5_9BURK
MLLSICEPVAQQLRGEPVGAQSLGGIKEHWITRAISIDHPQVHLAWSKRQDTGDVTTKPADRAFDRVEWS